MSLLKILVSGAVAGFAATFPMSAVMLVGREFLPEREQYLLPPSQIVSQVAQKVGVEEAKAGPEHTLIAAVSHFAYGAACGAVYAALPHRILPLPALKGSLFGLTVWGGSYSGLLPALEILSPATEHPVGRNILMITAHIVWGVYHGALDKLLGTTVSGRK
jgi:uncharacterized membrane protein YagU involved in acid resistance